MIGAIETIAGALLSINGVSMFVPPRQTRKGRKNTTQFRTECARYFAIPNAEVVFVTRSYEHFHVQDESEAEIVWRKRELWYVLTVRSDVLKICGKQIVIRRADELLHSSFTTSEQAMVRPEA